jgi:hypothetical protein
MSCDWSDNNTNNKEIMDIIPANKIEFYNIEAPIPEGEKPYFTAYGDRGETSLINLVTNNILEGPDKLSDPIYHYHFKCWKVYSAYDKNLVGKEIYYRELAEGEEPKEDDIRNIKFTGNVKLVPVFNSEIREYTIKLLNEDKSLIYETKAKVRNAEDIDKKLSISDILFAHIISIYKTNSIVECLASYHKVTSNPSFDRFTISKETLSKFQDCSYAYKEITSLKFDSFEEFLIKCDLMGI